MLTRLAKLAIAAKNRKQRSRDKYDAYEQALLKQMQQEKKQELELDGYIIKRFRIPMAQCRNCYSPQRTPMGIKEHKPERLSITMKKEAVNQ